MDVKEYVADSQLAFVNGEFQTALELGEKAIKEEPQNPDGYACAGNAALSLERYDKAIDLYRKAVEMDRENGNRYFMLGYACAIGGKAANALKYLTIAEELKCSGENMARLYTLLGILCFDIGKYDDSLLNFEKAEQLTGIDPEILQRKAIIYGIKNEIKKGVRIANQLKLINPTSYSGYRIAFNLLMQGKYYELAKKELEKAAKYTKPVMEQCFDRVSYEAAMQQEDGNGEHLETALREIGTALSTLQPKAGDVMEGYINAAELYLQKEDPKNALRCLAAAETAVDSYNDGFEIIPTVYQEEELTEADIDRMLEEDRAEHLEKYGEYGKQAVFEQTPADYDGSRDYMTTLELLDGSVSLPEDGQQESDVREYKLEGEEELSAENLDRINRLYIGAYTLLNDYSNMLVYGGRLAKSENSGNIYLGKYTEAKALKALGDTQADKKYAELAGYLRAEMIKDPGDINAATFRIRCLIDMKAFDEAEQFCSLLAPKLREIIREEINKAKEEVKS